MNIQKSAIDFFGNACYAYCLAFLFGQKQDFASLTQYVVTGLRKDWIDEDGFVSKPVQYVNAIGGYVKDVKKVKINDLSELPTGVYAVEYAYGTNHHFVVADKNRVVFDPWEDSNTVKYGKPVSYRYFVKE